MLFLNDNGILFFASQWQQVITDQFFKFHKSFNWLIFSMKISDADQHACFANK